MSGTDLGTLTAGQLLRLYRRREASPVEATKAALERIERFDPAVNAFCHVDEKGALAAARESEARWMGGGPVGALDGVPATIKDMALARGMPTLKGSRTVDPAGPWEDDSPYAARLREAGAVLLGKTTTPEFGWKGVTDCPLTGHTRNPWDTARTPGGSSGGAAAAAALNMGVLHQGSDAGGSIRIPCAFTGTAGIKPTFGFVPQWPASAMGTLSHLGPMARTVEDVARMLTIVGRPDDRDSLAGAPFEHDWTQGLSRGIQGLRVAYSRTLGYVHVHSDVARAVDAAVAVLRDLGADVEEVDPGFDDPVEAFNTLWFAGAARALGKLSPDKRAQVDPGLQEIAEMGAEISAVEYLAAMEARAALAERMAAFHRDWDLLVTPTMPLTAFPLGANVPPDSTMTQWQDWTPFTYPFNLTQQPAASVPCGFGDDGMPVGLHVVGARFDDATVLQLCAAYEAACPPAFPEAPRGA
ncbi:Aspartyl-tRNA(Asn) amidotransferase subunit A [Caenispirillum salinarum AK4]|uniref:Aspartyl-tRNA(Asn) amidotransferase subunit A n=1 Tax=Caenispirillum salinarum AK4 TaxID=1238182 RepID=K9GSB6_9PROT|nr:amidase [Caenispirillum salinarum]EKV27619.1 Aspartyl-tRNA(Asn) amidotransferase subunit A [Caenispirillum salinarum AK4]